MNSYIALATGYMVFQAMQSGDPAAVIGVTSKGIYIRNQHNRILFVSLEAFKSPLTITLTEPPATFQGVTSCSEVALTAGGLSIPAADLDISVDIKSVWYPDPVSGLFLPGVVLRLSRIADLVSKIKPTEGMAPLLPVLLQSNGLNPPHLPVELKELWPILQSIQQARLRQDTGDLVTSLSLMLGRGRGLTPSGDDLVIGFLLALNRWKDHPVALDSLCLPTLNFSMINNAYTKTTTLSANLIEIATLGHADERLLNLLDGIMTGVPPETDCAALALSLGNSTGIDSLVGMSLALL